MADIPLAKISPCERVSQRCDHPPREGRPDPPPMPPARSKGEPDLCGHTRFLRRNLASYALEHALELADQEHVLVHSDQGIAAVGFLFFSMSCWYWLRGISAKERLPDLRSSAGSTICDFGMANNKG